MNLNKLTSFMLFAISFCIVFLVGRYSAGFSEILTPSNIQFYFLGIIIFMILMLIFNLMFPEYKKGLKQVKSVKLKKKHSN